MSLELQLLVCAVALTVIQVVAAATGATMQVGLAPLAGNRDNVPEITGWTGRAQRAHRNMLENLVLFAALVLLNKADWTTQHKKERHKADIARTRMGLIGSEEATGWFEDRLETAETCGPLSRR